MDRIKHSGLSHAQVEERMARGQVNLITSVNNKSIKEIILKNSLTLFNLINALLAVIVIMVGSYKNLLFIISILVNTGIGIIQEIKAKRLIDKMSVDEISVVRLVRADKEVLLPKEEIVIDDILLLEKGSQVPVDVVNLDEKVYIDESLITGESELIEKNSGDKIFSGSIIVQGKSAMRAIAVGEDTIINTLTLEAKKIKTKKSKTQIDIDKILKVIAFLVIPVSLIIFLNQMFFTDLNFSSPDSKKLLLIGGVTAITNLIPEGLVLLASGALAIGAVKLSQKRVLAQDLPAIETLARVDTVCFDKTGTITEGKMTLSDVRYFSDNEKVDQIMSTFIQLDKDGNATTLALQEKYNQEKENLAFEKFLPFSSINKYQALQVKTDGTYILGAFDIVSADYTTEQEEAIHQAAKTGHRVLALVQSLKPIDDKDILKSSELLSLFFIQDKPKQSALEIIEFFKSQQIDIKVISGDHMDTVAAIAKEVGIDGNAIDLSQVNLEQEPTLDLEGISIYGRAKPKDKREIINQLQESGHVVAMVGDGINDVLALKNADCAIAFGNGEDATKSVAQFVLLDNDFSKVPLIMREGRKVINNINRVAGMSILRVIYTIVFVALMLFTVNHFPLESINLTLVGVLTIGVPSSLLILENDVQRIKNNFLDRIVKEMVPYGILIGISIFAFLIWTNSRPIYSVTSPTEISTRLFITDTTLIIGSLQLFVLYMICKPLSNYQKYVILFSMLIFYTTYFITPISRFIGTTSIKYLYFIVPIVLCMLAIKLVSLIYHANVKEK